MVPGEHVPRVCFGLIPRTAWQACLRLTARWQDPPNPPLLQGQLLWGQGGLQAKTIARSTSSSKMEREGSVVWLACRFMDILYRKALHILT